MSLSVEHPPQAATEQPRHPRAVAPLTATRLAALGGVTFFVLIVLFGSMTANFPAATDTRREMVGYLADHHGRLQVAAVLLALAMPAVLVFLSGLFRALRRAEGGTSRLALAALCGGVLAAASTVTGAVVLGTTANRFADLGFGATRAFVTLFLLNFGATLLGELLMIGTTTVVSLQRNLFARWFGLASVLLALASGVGAWTIGYAAAGIQVVAGVTLVLNSAWILLVSTFLWRRPELAAP